MANIWLDNETKLLITLWSGQKVQEQLENHSVRNNVVFAKLAKGMTDGGFNRNAKQCQSKIKHLREKYRKYKDKIARSGAGAENPPKFFSEMDEVLGTRPQTRPTFLLDSGNLEANVDDDSESSCSEFNLLSQTDQNSSPSDGNKGGESSAGDDDSISGDMLDQSLSSTSSKSATGGKRQAKTNNTIAAGSPKKRKTRHKPNKFQSAVESFKDVLTGQHEENLKLTTSIQQQWLDLEKQRVQTEQEERECERLHEMRMMQLFSTMVNPGAIQVPQQQISIPSTNQHHQPTYTDISHSSPSSSEYFPNFHFH